MSGTYGVERSVRNRRHGVPMFRCQVCFKLSYATRKEAKKEVRRLRQVEDVPGAILTTYRCPADATRWHVGHDRYREQQVIEETREGTAIPRTTPLDI